MPQRLDQLIILECLRTLIGEKFVPFCGYCAKWIEKETGVVGLRLCYIDLSGSCDADKMQSLVRVAARLGYLPHLVLGIFGYYRREQKGKIENVIKTGLHLQMYLAALDLWSGTTTRSMALKALDHLGQEINPKFGKLWKKCKAAVAKATALAPQAETLPKLTAHLARCQELYQEAGQREEAHDWLGAREVLYKLEKLQPGFGDVSDRLKPLEDKENVRRLQELVQSSSVGLPLDDRLPWSGPYPYRLARELQGELTPASSMGQAQQALDRLNKEDRISPSERAGLEALLDSEGRLFIDAFLYPIQSSKEVVDATVQAFFEKDWQPGIDAVPGVDDPEQQAAMLYTMGAHAEASDVLDRLQREQPLEGRLAHAQGLIHLGQACDADQKGDHHAWGHWRLALAQWAVSLADDAYWNQWCRGRYDCYGKSFVFTAVDNLGEKIVEYLRKQLTLTEDPDSAEEAVETREERQQRQQYLAVELATVGLISGLGGIPLDKGRLAWFGPGWMAHFGLEQALARYVATTDLTSMPVSLLPDGLSPEQAMRRVRWLFSFFAPAAVHLVGPAPDPEKALKELSQSVTEVAQSAPDCGDAGCPVHGAAPALVPVCCPAWDQFDLLNPAYRQVDGRVELMHRDARILALEAHLHQALTPLGDLERLNQESLEKQWREVLQLAQGSPEEDAIRRQIKKNVLAATDLSSLTASLLGEAISVVELGLELLPTGTPPAPDQVLRTRLVNLLISRGNLLEDRNDLVGAMEDLQRALDLAPHDHQSRTMLASLWGKHAKAVMHSDRYLAMDCLRRARDIVEDGQKKYPAYTYEDLLEWIEKSYQNMQVSGPGAPGEVPGQSGPKIMLAHAAKANLSELAQAVGQGAKELRESRPDLALETYAKALERYPEDPELQQGAIEALITHVQSLIEDGDGVQAQNLMETWTARLPARAGEMKQLQEFYSWWPSILVCLKQGDSPIRIKYLFYPDKARPEVLLPWESEHLEQVLVIMRVEGEDLCMEATLPLFAGDGSDVAIRNLLLATRDTLLLKVTVGQHSELLIKGLLPLKLLEPPWFELFANETAKYADTSLALLNDADGLLKLFQERRSEFGRRFLLQDHLPYSGKALEKVCKKRKLAFRRLTKQHYTVQVQRKRDKREVIEVELEAFKEGTRLACALPIPAGRPLADVLEQAVELNAEPGPGKLSLGSPAGKGEEDLTLLLSVELPFLDTSSAAAALDYLEQRSAELEERLSSASPK